MAASHPPSTFLYEEISDDNPGDFYNNDATSDRRDQITVVTEEIADRLYDEAGKDVDEITKPLTVLPAPIIITTEDERLIYQAKTDLSITHELDQLQIQAILGKKL